MKDGFIHIGNRVLPAGDVFVKAKPAVSLQDLPPMPPMETVDVSGIQRKWLNVSYAPLSQAQTLALFLPNEGDGPFPLVIVIHGGGFAFGDNMGIELKLALEPGLARGYAIASINYRLSEEAKFPAAIEDVKAAIRFLRANAEEYLLNPDRFGLWGESSGANLAALAGTTSLMTTFSNPEFGNAGVSEDVSAVVEFCGPISFLEMDPQFKVNGIDGQVHDSPDSFESMYLGADITTVPWLVKETNPQTYINVGCPPFFIEHGTMDANIPYQQSVVLSQKLLAALPDTAVNLRLLDGATHCSEQFAAPENVAMVYDFLDLYLKE